MEHPALTPSDEQANEDRWLTLGLARALLGINEATLRSWADQGLVRAFRTPGGHRRFSAQDIHALMSAGPVPASVRIGGSARLLPRIRQQVRGSARSHVPAWMAAFDDAGHERMRVLGREFVELCTGYIDNPGREDARERAALLGKAYGDELSRRGVPLADALEAFSFFRNATVNAIKPALLKRRVSAEGVYNALQNLNELTDEAMRGLFTYYGGGAPQGDAPESGKRS